MGYTCMRPRCALFCRKALALPSPIERVFCPIDISGDGLLIKSLDPSV